MQFFFSIDERTTVWALIKKAQSNKSKAFRKGVEKTFTKHEVNVLIEKKLKKSFKGRKRKFQDLKSLVNPLTTAMHLVKAITAEA